MSQSNQSHLKVVPANKTIIRAYLHSGSPGRLQGLTTLDAGKLAGLKMREFEGCLELDYDGTIFRIPLTNVKSMELA